MTVREPDLRNRLKANLKNREQGALAVKRFPNLEPAGDPTGPREDDHAS